LDAPFYSHVGKLVAAVSGPQQLVEAADLWVPLLGEAGLDGTLGDAAKVTDELGATMIARLRDAAAEVIRRQGVLRITTEIAWFHARTPLTSAGPPGWPT
jgi:hypothetical protein